MKRYWRLSRGNAQKVFVECLFWSAVLDMQWFILINPDLGLRDELTNKLKTDETVGFVWEFTENSNKFLVVGYKKNLLKSILNSDLREKAIRQPEKILNVLSSIAWEHQDYNKHYLLYLTFYQQALGTMFDSICAGVITFLPKSWSSRNEKLNIHVKHTQKTNKLIESWLVANPNKEILEIEFIKNLWDYDFFN